MPINDIVTRGFSFSLINKKKRKRKETLAYIEVTYHERKVKNLQKEAKIKKLRKKKRGQND